MDPQNTGSIEQVHSAQGLMSETDGEAAMNMKGRTDADTAGKTDRTQEMINMMMRMMETTEKHTKEIKASVEKYRETMGTMVEEINTSIKKRLEDMDNNTNRVEGIKKKGTKQNGVVNNVENISLKDVNQVAQEKKENCSLEGPISNYDDSRDSQINLMKGNLADAEVPPSSRPIRENTNFNNHILSRNE